MVVISDTSVISNLLLIGHLHLLPALFGQAVIPSAVFEELMQLKPPFRFGISDFPWLEVRAVENNGLATQLLAHLDAGESEAIVLAEELKADILLIDEAKGRKIAQGLGIPVTGLLGVLLAAKDKKHIGAVTPLMDRLIHEANFRIGSHLYQLIQMEAGE